MSLRLVLLLVVLTGVTGSPGVTINADSADMKTLPNSVPDMMEGAQVFGQVRNTIRCLRRVIVWLVFLKFLKKNESLTK